MKINRVMMGKEFKEIVSEEEDDINVDINIQTVTKTNRIFCILLSIFKDIFAIIGIFITLTMIEYGIYSLSTAHGLNGDYVVNIFMAAIIIIEIICCICILIHDFKTNKK